MANTPAQKVVSGTLAADVAAGGTFTVTYPTGFNKGSFDFGGLHSLVVAGNTYKQPKDFTVSLGTSSATITNAGTSTWPAGSSFVFGFAFAGVTGNRPVDVVGNSLRARMAPTVLITLGAAATADADGVSESQTVTGAGTAFVLDGVLADPYGNTYALFDVPRNVVGAWTNAAKLTIYGEDEFGARMVEQTPTATTSHTGKKAFKKITRVTTSATITGATVGTGNVLGLPVAVLNSQQILQEYENGSATKQVGRLVIPWELEATELAAGTAENLVSPVDGYIDTVRGVVQEAIVTGGAITVEVNTVTVTGLTITAANSDTVGTRYSDRPTTPRSSTTAVAKGDRITITPAAAFNGGGAINGTLEIEAAGVMGTFVGADVNSANSLTSGDIRGTYTPATTPDGTVGFDLLVALANPAGNAAAQYYP